MTFIVIDGCGIEPVDLTVYLQRLLVLVVHKYTQRHRLLLHLIFLLYPLFAYFRPNEKWLDILDRQFFAHTRPKLQLLFCHINIYLKQAFSFSLVFLQMRMFLGLKIAKQFQVKTIIIKLKSCKQHELKCFDGFLYRWKYYPHPFSSAYFYYLSISVLM